MNGRMTVRTRILNIISHNDDIVTESNAFGKNYITKQAHLLQDVPVFKYFQYFF